MNRLRKPAFTSVAFVIATLMPMPLTNAIVQPDRSVLRGEADYTTVITYTAEDGEQYVNCTGVLISPTTVLTAAHCFLDESMIANMTVRTGAVVGDEPAISRKISAVVLHRKYMRVIDAFTDGGSGTGVRKGENDYDSDIALVQLGSPVLSVRPATLAPQGYLPAPGWRTYGYGATGTYEDESPTRFLTAPQIDVSGRLVELDRPHGRVLLAAAPSGTLTGTCWGDSGGPLVDGAGVVIGVTSFGFDDVCATREPTVFTRVSSFEDWIRQATRTARAVAPAVTRTKSALPMIVRVG